MLKGKKAGLFYVEREGKAYEDKDLVCIGFVADERMLIPIRTTGAAGAGNVSRHDGQPESDC